MENVTTGHYVFKSTKEHYFFDEEKMHISPNTPRLQDIVTKEFSVCGNINVPMVPLGVRQVRWYTSPDFFLVSGVGSNCDFLDPPTLEVGPID